MRKTLFPVLAVAVGLLCTGCSDTNNRNRTAETGTADTGKTADHVGAMAGSGGVSSGQGTMGGNGSGSGTGTNSDRSNRTGTATGMGDTSTNGSGTSMSGTSGHNSPGQKDSRP